MEGDCGKKNEKISNAQWKVILVMKILIVFHHTSLRSGFSSNDRIGNIGHMVLLILI